jgi:hypothetical protein
MNYYPLLIALGLLFLAASSLVTHSTGRIALIVLSCVAFLVSNHQPSSRRHSVGEIGQANPFVTMRASRRWRFAEEGSGLRR